MMIHKVSAASVSHESKVVGSVTPGVEVEVKVKVKVEVEVEVEV